MKFVTKYFLKQQFTNFFSQVVKPIAKKEIEDRKKAIADYCPYPIGANYVQYPTTAEPATFWKNTKWKELDFQGAFFRASGGNANDFINAGEELVIQEQEIQKHKHTIEAQYVRASGDPNSFIQFTRNRAGTWNGGNAGISNEGNEVFYVPEHETLETGSGETRPMNFTIRIWKRTE